MRRDDKPSTSWPARVTRGRLPDRNPLRRRSDRIETTLLALLLAGLAAAAPFFWHATATWAAGNARQEAMSQRATERQVPGVLLQDPATVTGYGGYPGLGVPLAPARWTAPSGRQVTGLIPVPGAALRKGSSVRIWVDQTGQLTDGPLRPDQISGRGELAAVAGLVLLVLVAAGTGRLCRWALDRHRLARWGAEWRAAGPRWTSRR